MQASFSFCSHVSAQPSQDQAHRELVYGLFHFHKRSQDLIGTYDETLSVVTMRVSNQIVRRAESML
jgi:hypothetical protein